MAIGLRTPGAARLPWIVLILMLVVQVAYVARYGRNLPRADEWKDVSVLMGDQAFTPKWLWTPHEVHRIPLPRLVRFALYRLSGRDFRAALFFNVAVMAAAAALILRAAARAPAPPSRLEAFIPLLLLGPLHYQNFLWGFQVQLALSSALFLAACAVAASIEGIPSPRTLAGLAALVLMQALTGASGIALAVPLMAWLGVALLRSRRDRAAAWWLATGCLALTAAVVVAYPFGLAVRPAAASLRSTLQTCFQFLSTSLGAGEPLWRDRAFFVVALAAVAFVLFVRAFRHRPDERWRSSALVACLVSMALLAAFVALGRAGVTTGAGLQGRYTTIAAPIVCLAYFGPRFYGSSRTRSIVAGLLLGATVLGLLVGIVPAFAYGEYRRRQLAALERDVQLGLPIDAIAARNGTALSDFSEGARLSFARLAARRAWPFEGYRPDLGVRTQVVARTLVPLTSPALRDLAGLNGVYRPTGARADLLLRLPRPLPVAKIEMRYVLETPRQRFTVLEVFWGRLPEGATDLPADAEFAGFPIVPVSGARQLTALVYQTIDAIRIHVDPAVSRLEILEVAVLELAPDWIP